MTHHPSKACCENEASSALVSASKHAGFVLGAIFVPNVRLKSRKRDGQLMGRVGCLGKFTKPWLFGAVVSSVLRRVKVLTSGTHLAGRTAEAHQWGQCFFPPNLVDKMSAA